MEESPESSTESSQIELLEEDKILIMELVAKKCYGDKNQKDSCPSESCANPTFDDEDYFHETNQLSKEDRTKIINSTFLEQFVNNKKKYLSEKEGKRLSKRDEMQYFSIVEKVKNQNINEDSDLCRPRDISEKDRQSIINILCSLQDKVVIEESYTLSNQPTRVNSKINSPEKRKSDKDECANILFENNPKKDPQTIEKKNVEIHENVAKKRCIKKISNDNKEVTTIPITSNSSLSYNQLDDSKSRFLKYFETTLCSDELQGVNAGRDRNSPKESIKSLVKIEKRNICDYSDIGERNPPANNSYYSGNLDKYDKEGEQFVIEEQYFVFEMYKTPMDDEAGPFFIDKEEVAVDVYQDGLLKQWNPTQVVHEICTQCQWTPPDFVQHDYKPEKGFHFGVIIENHHFVPVRRAGTKKLSKHLASTFFLKFLGFKFSFKGGRDQHAVVPLSSLGKQVDQKYDAIIFKDTRKYYKTPGHKWDQPSTSTGFNKTQLSSEHFDLQCDAAKFKGTKKYYKAGYTRDQPSTSSSFIETKHKYQFGKEGCNKFQPFSRYKHYNKEMPKTGCHIPPEIYEGKHYSHISNSKFHYNSMGDLPIRNPYKRIKNIPIPFQSKQHKTRPIFTEVIKELVLSTQEETSHSVKHYRCSSSSSSSSS